MKKIVCAVMMGILCAFGAQAVTKVASLHPMLSDMARNVGGNVVEVVDLFPANGELHAFEPTAADVAQATGAQLVLACGKGVEPYLEDLRDSLPARTQVIELGQSVPDVCLPGSTVADPHWWNSPTAMKRASRALRSALERLAPADKVVFAKGQRAYSAQMDTLVREAKLAFAAIPHEKRVLVCSHAAMSHFCKDFGFTALAVHGIAQESEGDTASLARILAELRSKSVPCLFYGVNEPPKVLRTIATQVGAQALPLALDGINPATPTYTELFRFNVKNIVEGLSR
ncbi:MAG: zinc ABC transporter substrate-binding protein [Akkermansia sp.]|nr:zinc ABC transporter substrate-binding protein [Akkermansia sp.]